MSYINKIARSENGENSGVVKASGVREVVVYLESQADSIGKQVYHAARRVAHPRTAQRLVGATGIGEEAQVSMGTVEELEGFATSVDDGGSDHEPL